MTSTEKVLAPRSTSASAATTRSWRSSSTTGWAGSTARSPSSAAALSFGYDARGNLKSKTSSVDADINVCHAYPDRARPNRLTGATIDGSSLPRTRGHTGHEHLDRTGFIHRGGRVYDPTLGRFLSPDPIVANTASAQAWNGYSYVSNSPMSLVDPSGLSQRQASGGCVMAGFMCRQGGAAGGGFGLASVVSTHHFHWVDVFFSFVSSWFNPGWGGLAGTPPFNPNAPHYFRGGGGVGDGGWGSYDYPGPFYFGMTIFFGTVTFQVHDQVLVMNIPKITVWDIDGKYRDRSKTGVCTCVGNARILEGNSDHISTAQEPVHGGFGPRVLVTESSVAIDPVQFGGADVHEGKRIVRPYLGKISGYVDGQLIFDNVADVIGGDTPIPGMNVRDAMRHLHPDTLILELPGGDEDLGIVPIKLSIPCALNCPSGTE